MSNCEQTVGPGMLDYRAGTLRRLAGLRKRTRFDTRSIKMRTSTKDQVRGTLHELKGKAKAKAGQLTNNPTLKAKGQAESLAGKVQKKVGQIKKVFEK